MITLSIGPKLLGITNESLTEYYTYSDIKSVSPFYGYGNSGSFVLINFINENRDSSLKIKFESLDPSMGFQSVTEVVDAITSAIGNDNTYGLSPKVKYTRAFKDSDSGTVNAKVHSIAFGNTGSVNVRVFISSEELILAPGETISFDAGALNNMLIDMYQWDATGGEILITYVTPA